MDNSLLNCRINGLDNNKPRLIIIDLKLKIKTNLRLFNLSKKRKILIITSVTKGKKFNLNDYELEILKKISEWPKCVEISSNKLEPHRIPFYLYELVSLFHSYWNLGKERKELRFILENENLNTSRLLLLQALSIVIKNAMKILGVSTPRSM